jgi:hypothetical protein
MRYMVVMILLVGGLVVETAEATGVLERESLRGLSGVFVVVEELGPDGKRSGLSVETIRTAVERILRASGVQVLIDEEGRTGLSAAVLEINATPVKSEKVSVYGVNITGVVIQQVFLRNGSEMKTPAITWGKSHTIVVSAKSVKTHVMGHVESIAKDFANDFLSVNPSYSN